MFCENCGKEIKDSNKFCPNCGSTVKKINPIKEDKVIEKTEIISKESKKESMPKVKKDQPKNSHGKMIAIIVGVVIIAIVAIFCVIKFRSKSDTEISESKSSVEDAWGKDNGKDEEDSSKSGEKKKSSETSDTKKTDDADKSEAKESDTSSEVNNAEYILPEAQTKYYTEDELKEMDAHTLYLARNEMYARHGYTFKNEDLQQYFGDKSWYTATKTEVPISEFNDCEQKNIELIKALEKKVN